MNFDSVSYLMGCEFGGGGGGTKIVIDGKPCEYTFAYPCGKEIIKAVGPKNITIRGCNDFNRSFSNWDSVGQTSDLIDLSGLKIWTSEYDNSGTRFSALFSGCSEATALPTLMNETKFFSNSKGANMFHGCYYVRNMDQWLNNTIIPNYSSDEWQQTFQACYSLRSIPESFLKQFTGGMTGKKDWSLYYLGFYNCASLDELKSLGVYVEQGGSSFGNIFSSSFGGCSRLKALTFDTNNGQPIESSLGAQVIDLTTNVGYASLTTKGYILNYNSGITADKEVTDAASYEALKNDPDWFTRDVAFSRYNHDSAVETINSLPDCTNATSGNTIKFLGGSGSATDGGAISTLTEEEIAVAATKNWTVTLS